MASRSFFEIESPNLKEVIISGRFFPNGTELAGTVVPSKGKGFRVTHTGVAGRYTVTLDDRYNDLIGHDVSIQVSALQAWAAQFGDYVTTGTLPTIEVRTRNAGTLEDLTANANNSVGFSLTLKNTSV